MLCRLLDAAQSTATEGTIAVNLADGAYDSLYNAYEAVPCAWWRNPRRWIYPILMTRYSSATPSR